MAECLALACSPRRKGNTAIMAGQVLAGCREVGGKTKLLYLSDFHCEPCRACGGCQKTGKCVLNDEAGFLYDQILATDRLILAAPIFSMGINAQAKAFIDRSQKLWATKYLLGKKVIDQEGRLERKGVYLSCGGTDIPGLFRGALQVVRYFFKIIEMELSTSLCYEKVDWPGEIRRRDEAMKEAYDWGLKLGAD